jgi:SAM-dependent methyltransferase
MEIPVEEFDEAYEAVERSARVAALVREALGGDLPPEVEPYSFVPLAGLRRIATALRLTPGDTVVDLACGRGGPGMWVTRETGARLVGVDYSPVALAQAQARASLFGLDGRVRFLHGHLHATGLPDASADAVMCVDAFQFGDPSSTAREIARILRPKARVAVTSWRPVHVGDEALPERLRDLDVAGVLRAANLSILVNDAEPDWMEMQRRVFELALAAGDPGDDQALANLQREAERVLPSHERVERVFVVAERPALAGA